MNFMWLNWRLYPGSIHTRAFLCEKCWAELEKFMEKDDSGSFSLHTSQGIHKMNFLVYFSTKGAEEVPEMDTCKLCNGFLPGWGEEVYFTIPVEPGKELK